MDLDFLRNFLIFYKFLIFSKEFQIFLKISDIFQKQGGVQQKNAKNISVIVTKKQLIRKKARTRLEVKTGKKGGRVRQMNLVKIYTHVKSL